MEFSGQPHLLFMDGPHTLVPDMADPFAHGVKARAVQGAGLKDVGHGLVLEAVEASGSCPARFHQGKGEVPVDNDAAGALGAQKSLMAREAEDVGILDIHFIAAEGLRDIQDQGQPLLPAKTKEGPGVVDIAGHIGSLVADQETGLGGQEG